MKKILFIALMFTGMAGFSQEKFKISGKIETDSYHVGGAYKEYLPNPQPLANYSLLLLRFDEGDSIPQIVKTFKSDDQGNFSLSVKHGFAAVSDSITAHQCVPTGFYNQDEMFNTSSSTWTINNDVNPIFVTSQDVLGVSILNYNYSVCGMCP